MPKLATVVSKCINTLPVELSCKILPRYGTLRSVLQSTPGVLVSLSNDSSMRVICTHYWNNILLAHGMTQ